MSFFYRPSLISVSSSGYFNGTELVLSDHSRSPLQIESERIEFRERMASGYMRSKHIADKHTFSTSWEMLPSRRSLAGKNITADGYASATEMSQFYESTKGAFTLKIYSDAGLGSALSSQGLYGTFTVFFSSFSTEIVKRGKDFDFYNVSLAMEQA